MNDEEFDELLRDAAATYNTPPVAPRDAMWEAISARRSANVVPMRSTRPVPRWLLGSVAAAAVLMIGIAIGRSTRTNSPTGEVAAATSSPASTRSGRPAKAVAPAAASTTPMGDVASTDDQATAGGALDAVVSAQPRRLGAIEQSRPSAPRLATTGVRARAGTRSGSGGDAFNDADAYRLAVIEHLTRTEVLLTDFRVEARAGNAAKLDAQFASVARELLGTTRLLLATRRGDDPVMTRLLQDLEYVLMQLSQYANDGRGVDLDAINQSIDRRNVLPKLRYSIPAGVSASAGT